MTPRDTAILALLLLQVPGCSALTGPSTVTGTVGGSLSLQCQYEEKYKTFDKYWCRKSKSFSLICGEKVEIKGSESRVRKGRMSITDHPENLTFTVTLENLTLKDADSYQCGISTPWIEGRDDSLKVEVFVISVPRPESTTSILGPPMFPSGHTWPSTTREDTPDLSLQPRSLLSSVHFLLLIFLEVPLFLSLLSAVLWVNRPLRRPAGQNWPDYDNQ